MLEENVSGRICDSQEVLKEFVGEESAAKVAPYWAGDRYAVFEDRRQSDGTYRARASR